MIMFTATPLNPKPKRIMIQPNELRIGNYLQLGTLIGKVYVIDQNGESPLVVVFGNNDFVRYEIEYYEPIPLTEEWLVKFGFNHHYGGFNNQLQIEMHGDTNKYILVCDDSTVPTPFIEYVHSLQNLYFVLTGEELTIK